jgi:hypothetical protein
MTAVVPLLILGFGHHGCARWTAETHQPRGVLASESQSPCTPRFLQHLPVLCVTCVIRCAMQPSTRKRVTLELYATLTGEQASAGNAAHGTEPLRTTLCQLCQAPALAQSRNHTHRVLSKRTPPGPTQTPSRVDAIAAGQRAAVVGWGVPSAPNAPDTPCKWLRLAEIPSDLCRAERICTCDDLTPSQILRHSAKPGETQI